MNAQPAFITPTRETLERAGLRLELAASAFNAFNAKPSTRDDEWQDEEFRRLEEPYLRARREYRAMIELLTGQDADAVERRLTA